MMTVAGVGSLLSGRSTLCAEHTTKLAMITSDLVITCLVLVTNLAKGLLRSGNRTPLNLP